MKKGVTILLVILIISGFFTGMIAASEDLLVGREFSVEGIGVVASDLEVGTKPYYSGIKLDERISTPGGGFTEPSWIQYSSSFEMGIYNVTGANSSAEIEYTSTSKILNVKRMVYMKNYDLGAVMGVKTRGDSEQEVSIYSEDLTMEAEVSGDITGDLTLFTKAIDTRDRHNVITRDVIDLSGEFEYDWSAWIEENQYPAGENDKEWLGCP